MGLYGHSVLDMNYSLLHWLLMPIMCCVAFQFKIRKEALVGLGQIYRRCCENDVPDDIKCVSWIRNKVLHAYYHSAVDDKYSSTLTISCHLFSIFLS